MESTTELKSLPTASVHVGEKVACYLGIDSGSTTTKIVVLDEEAPYFIPLLRQKRRIAPPKSSRRTATILHLGETQQIDFPFNASCATVMAKI